MPYRVAALLALFLAARPVAGAEGTGSTTRDPGQGDRAAEPERRSQGTAPRAEPTHRREADEEVIAHLEELERLELLRHLELFDTAAPPATRPAR